MREYRAMSVPFYEFQDPRYWLGDPPAVAIVAESQLPRTMDAAWMLSRLGGCLRYVSERDGSVYLGVWGAPRVAALRAALEKLGLHVEPKAGRPPFLELHSRRTGEARGERTTAWV